MPTLKRYPVKGYKGVFYIEGTAIGSDDPERIYYIRYKKAGKSIEEPAGRAGKPDKMTAAGASALRAQRMKGILPSNEERREAKRAAKLAEAGKWTFSRLWLEYKAGRPGQKRSATDETNFTLYLSPTFGDKEPSEVVPLDVDRLRRSLSKRGKAPGTVKNVLELFRRISNFGEKMHLCARLPFPVSMPKVNNQKTEDLTPEQTAKLLKILREGIVENEKGEKTLLDEDARDIMLTALFTGMRRGEIFRLRWDDVDFQRGFIRIVEPKGGTDQTIPLPDGARELLEHRPRPEGCPFVFPGRVVKAEDGTKTYRPKADASKHFRAIREAAGLPKQTDGKPFRPLHGLRHVFASTLASSGEVDLYVIQKLLTHKSPAMTARYSHLRDDTLKRASNVAGRIMRETEAGQGAMKAEGTNE